MQPVTKHKQGGRSTRTLLTPPGPGQLLLHPLHEGAVGRSAPSVSLQGGGPTLTLIHLASEVHGYVFGEIYFYLSPPQLDGYI